MVDWLSYIRRISSFDIFQFLEDVNVRISGFAEKIHLPQVILFSVGIALALVIGLFGYKLIKTLMGFAFGFGGYLIGTELFALLLEKFDKLPGWLVYVSAALVALLFVFLAFAKTSYALYAVTVLFGYFVMSFYVDNVLLAIGGAVVLATIMVSLIRVFFILTTCVLSGLLVNSFLNPMLPADSIVVQNKWIGFAIIAGVALFCDIIQFVATRHDEAEV